MELDISKISKSTLSGQRVLLITLIAAVFLVTMGILSGDIGVLSNTVAISLFIVLVPQIFSKYGEYRNLKEMEEKFPTFLRDLTESIRSGMPFHKAIMNTKGNEYGALSKEIKKMSDQLSWGMTLDKVLDKFSYRVKSSKRLYTAVRLVRESYMSGGDVVSTLESVAENSNILEDSEKERKSLLSEYVLLMYGISIVFVIIVGSINKFLIPVFDSTISASGTTIGLSNPCAAAFGINRDICGVFQSIALLFTSDVTTVGAYYTSLFFVMSMMQSVLSGMVVGQISERSVVAGLKHSVILSIITFSAFGLMVKFGFLGI